MSFLRKAWATLKKWWWVLVGAAGLVAAWVFLGSRKKPIATKDELLTGKPTKGSIDSLRQVAVLEAERASTDVLIEKARADTKVEAKREELDRIKKDTDPVARRRKMASWAERNI